jgi:hypothetical protein
VIVLCTSNSGKDLPADGRDPRSGYDEHTEFYLTVGTSYVVYAMTEFLGAIWYYIADDSYSYYPVWQPSPLFTVVDHAIPRCWIYNYFAADRVHDDYPILAFPEWALDEYFYDRLTNGSEAELGIWQERKAQMDWEAQHDPS